MTNLKLQLQLYDYITKEERKRIIEGYKKFKDRFLEEDLILECKNEILDAFGYLTFMQMKKLIKRRGYERKSIIKKS